MPWKLDSQKPIYAQLVEKVQLDIVTGRYQPGEKLPSVRELAASAAVNPNTMQKALSELEGSGLLYALRTSGRFVTDDTGLIQEVRQQLASAEVRTFVEKMHRLGMTSGEITALMQDIIREETL